jgi:hypothetical protein
MRTGDGGESGAAGGDDCTSSFACRVSASLPRTLLCATPLQLLAANLQFLEWFVLVGVSAGL